jgi:putative transposase
MKRGRTQIDDSVYPLFVTTTVTDFIPVFRDDALARVVLRILEEQRQTHRMSVYAYVLMPNHFHAIVRSSRVGDTSRFLGAWKSLTAHVILDSVPAAWREVFVAGARRYGEPERKSHKVWMTRFDDLALRFAETFSVKLQYIHHNPVRAGLVERAEDYAYSSARFHLTRERDRFVGLSDCGPLFAGGGIEDNGRRAVPARGQPKG